jgi:hypothetical protein
MMDEFIKYCEKQYNIQQGCPTIQVGTLAYYRKMDPAFSIADSTEQSEKTIIESFNTTNAPKNVIDHLSTLHIEGGNNNIFENCTQEIFFPNSLIYCLSTNTGGDHLENAKRLDPKYDSFYKISNINAFAAQLTYLIFENFKMDWFDEGIQIHSLTISDLQKVRLVSIHKPVLYVDSKTATIKNNQLTSSSPLESIYHRIVFTKGKEYINNREYRLLFAFFHPDIGVLPVKTSPIILSLSSLARWLV